MKSIVIHIILIFSCMAYLQAQGDVRLKLDSTEFMIGDQTELTIGYRGSENPVKFNILQETLDTMAQVELLGKGPVQRNVEGDITLIEQKLRVAFFDTGFIWIPAIPVVLEYISGLDTLETNEIPIRVFSPQLDSLSMAPIKDIIREPWLITDAWPYFLAALILVLLYLNVRRRKRKKAVSLIEEEEVIIKSPYEIAMEAINDLSEIDQDDEAQVKEYFASLSIILRTFIEGRFEFPAAESTTFEIGSDMIKRAIPEELVEPNIELLNKVDMIKFAKIKPTVEDIKTVKPQVIQSVEDLENWAQTLNQDLPDEERIDDNSQEEQSTDKEK